MGCEFFGEKIIFHSTLVPGINNDQSLGSKHSQLRKLGSLGEYFIPGFSTPSFPFCNIPKTESSEMKTLEFFS